MLWTHSYEQSSSQFQYGNPSPNFDLLLLLHVCSMHVLTHMRKLISMSPWLPHAEPIMYKTSTAVHPVIRSNDFMVLSSMTLRCKKYHTRRGFGSTKKFDKDAARSTNRETSSNTLNMIERLKVLYTFKSAHLSVSRSVVPAVSGIPNLSADASWGHNNNPGPRTHSPNYFDLNFEINSILGFEHL